MPPYGQSAELAPETQLFLKIFAILLALLTKKAYVGRLNKASQVLAG